MPSSARVYIAVASVHRTNEYNSYFLSCFFCILCKVSWYQSSSSTSLFPFLSSPLMEANNQDFLTNPSHELFLHPSDNPNNTLVNELLNGRNYATWKKSMEISLIAKNKLGFVYGTTAEPAANTPQHSQWNRCDKMVISWILHAVDKRISDNILFSVTSRQIWQDLEQ